MAECPELVLIDGHALAYRRFFAMQRSSRRLTAPDGRPTDATFGFTQALLSYLGEKPDYIAVTFDKGFSGRETIYSQYKQNRSEIPPDLEQQLNDIEAMVRAFNIPVLTLESYEADDIIGTIAKQAEEQGCDIRIITGDKDLLQLLGEHVTVQIPPASNSKNKNEEDKLWTVENFPEGFGGLKPSQLIDYKGLKGDTSDNIPGIGGIGDKTATKLLLQFGSLEGIYENLDKLSVKDREKLQQGREIAFLSRELATIKRDVPIQLDLAACHTRDFDPKTVIKLFDELGFGSNTRSRFNNLLDEKQRADMEERRKNQPFFIPDHTIVLEQYQLEALVEKLNSAEKIAFDTETTSLDKMQASLVGISLSINGERGYYIPVGHHNPNPQPSLFEPNTDPSQLPLETVLEALRPALTNPDIPKIAHNGLYDLIVMRRYGIDVSPLAEDTMVKAWVIDPSDNIGLKDVAAHYFDLKMREINSLIGTGKNQITMDRVSIEDAAAYAAADAVVTYRLLKVLNEKIEPRMQELYQTLEMPLIPILADMEMTGILIDKPYLSELSKKFSHDLSIYEQRIHELAREKFNVNSPKELNRILFDKLHLPTEGLRKTQTTGFSVDAFALEELDERLGDEYPILREILNYRSLAKLLGTYVDAMPAIADRVTGRVHTSFNQTGTVTGRLSSSNPNLQNIPIRTEEGRRVRKAFIAEKGHLLMSVDYSQFELRILAHYSGDQTLKQAFMEGQDIHRATAAKIYNLPPEQITSEQRRFAKTVNFGLMYGMGAFRLARESELTLSEAQKFIDAYFKNFPGVQEYLQRTEEFVKDNGYVQTLFGRRRYFQVQTRTGGEKRIDARTWREAINMPIQGTNADIMKKAMIDLDRELKARKHRARILLQVHDELVLEVPEDEIEAIGKLAVETLCSAGKEKIEDVPVVADARVGKNWDEMKPL